MISKRTIVNLVVVVVMAAIVIAAGVAGSRRAVDPVCSKIAIIIRDSTERQYVTTWELQQQLQKAGLWQVGEKLSNISCSQIEQNLLTHPMLRQVECYELARGEVRIAVKQRQPVMLVAGDERYYLDSDRKFMPVRPSVNADVITVMGRIGRTQAQGEMYNFVTWLNGNRYWRKKIEYIRVINPKMVELRDSTNHYTLVLGTLDNAEQRLGDLKKLYEEGFGKIGYPKYEQIDLRYKNQIIGRK